MTSSRVPEEDGTAIGEGMALGIERLKDSTAKSRVMIVLTDGVNNAGETEPLQAAQIAKALGIKIYTIGAGTRGVAMIPVRSPSGQMVLQRTPVDIDERMLTEVATLTGGQYFPRHGWGDAAGDLRRDRSARRRRPT